MGSDYINRDAAVIAIDALAVPVGSDEIKVAHNKGVRRAQSVIENLPASTPWQPIETAPKGKEVLVLKANHKYAVADWGRYCKYNSGYFTHWMLIPDPLETGK